MENLSGSNVFAGYNYNGHLVSYWQPRMACYTGRKDAAHKSAI